jgi:replicative superfamily II helicase
VNKQLRELLNPQGKDWHNANNDFLIVSLLIEKHVNFQDINDPFYREMLNDELYHLVMTDSDYQEVIDELMNLMKTSSSFSSTIAGVLCESESEKVYYHLIEQLKEKYMEDSNLACCIIKGLNGMPLSQNNELLELIIKTTDDNDLRILASENIR